MAPFVVHECISAAQHDVIQQGAAWPINLFYNENAVFLMFKIIAIINFQSRKILSEDYRPLHSVLVTDKPLNALIWHSNCTS